MSAIDLEGLLVEIEERHEGERDDWVCDCTAQFPCREWRLATALRAQRDELSGLRELVKCKTPATLTASQAERMPPKVWVSKADHDEIVGALRVELRELMVCDCGRALAIPPRCKVCDNDE